MNWMTKDDNLQAEILEFSGTAVYCNYNFLCAVTVAVVNNSI